MTLSRLLHNPAYAMADEQVRLHYLGQGVEVTSPPEAFDGVHGVLLVGKREANARKYTKTENHRASVLNSVGIVPSPLFLAVQAKLTHNRQVGNSGKGKHTWLSGLLKCAKCGYSLSVVVDKSYRYLACSGRYNVNRCDAAIHVKLAELEAVVQTEIEKLLAQCPREPVVPKPEEDSYTRRLLELDRRAERLMDAFAESEDLPASYLQKALGKIEKEREALRQAQRRESGRIPLPEKLVFGELSFEEKKAVAAQFIRRIEVAEDSAEIIWAV